MSFSLPHYFFAGYMLKLTPEYRLSSLLKRWAASTLVVFRHIMSSSRQLRTEAGRFNG
jgi:hypothetical protein